MKASELTEGTFLDLTGLKLPVLQGGGSGRRHIPNKVRNVVVGRKWVRVTLGDYRVWKVEKEAEVATLTDESLFCICELPMAKIYLCPKHEG